MPFERGKGQPRAKVVITMGRNKHVGADAGPIVSAT